MLFLDDFRANNAAQPTQERKLCRYLVPSVLTDPSTGCFSAAGQQAAFSLRRGSVHVSFLGQRKINVRVFSRHDAATTVRGSICSECCNPAVAGCRSVRRSDKQEPYPQPPRHGNDSPQIDTPRRLQVGCQAVPLPLTRQAFNVACSR